MKKAIEAYWSGTGDLESLAAAGRAIRSEMWSMQAALDLIPVADFSWYDHVLDTCAMVGAVPERFGPVRSDVDLDTLLRMARGRAPSGDDTTALEMTKWFDTNYHYLVPEFVPDQTFRLSTRKVTDEVLEARDQRIPAKPVLLGPVTFLWLGKDSGFPRLDLLHRILPVYREVLAELERLGVSWVQADEPIFALDLPDAWRQALVEAYRFLGSGPRPKILVATYYGPLAENLETAVALPVDGLHVDLVRGPEDLDPLLANLPKDRIVSLGVVDGRNVWRTDLEAVLGRLEPIVADAPERFWIAPSCPLWHVPVDLATEHDLDPEIRGWLAFAAQKVEEVAILARALKHGRESVRDALDESAARVRSRAAATRWRREDVRRRLREITEADLRRRSPFERRREVQARRLNLPPFPTTTIGSFPQTPAIRKARSDLRAGRITDVEYEDRMREEIRRVIAFQEEVGLDVLVHGEPERSDMVAYFAEQLDGFAFTSNGWVQSYGSRCVKPPILFGDVARRGPMTVRWAVYAQSWTRRPVKGMLTGPVTMLQWSFVRDDQPRHETAMQIALAVRDEVTDLARAGISVIQIDEPALREGLPLRRRDWEAYLDWAVRCFRLASCGVEDDVQIHTHMCYAEFGDIIEAIAALDADVLSIEGSRSRMELLRAFETFRYPNGIGPGILDVHSPRVPPVSEMVDLLRRAAALIPPDRLWVNPDCGLKTRDWPEVQASIRNLVAAAKVLRSEQTARPPQPAG